MIRSQSRCAALLSKTHPTTGTCTSCLHREGYIPTTFIQFEGIRWVDAHSVRKSRTRSMSGLTNVTWWVH